MKKTVLKPLTRSGRRQQMPKVWRKVYTTASLYMSNIRVKSDITFQTKQKM